MFCDEPIKRVYQRQDWENKEGRWQDAFLEEAFNLEYHATDGHWLIFETENNVISIGFDGVKLWKTLEEAAPNPEELQDLSDTEDWEYTEHTLFVGERICDVQRFEKYWNIQFDHFSMRLYPYDNTKQTGFCLGGRGIAGFVYKPMAVGKHLISRKCSCGADAEIIIHFTGDYLVRCEKCHKSTWAGMCLIDAIEEWEAGETPIQLDTGEEELIKQAAKERIKAIEVSKEGFWLAKASLCDTEQVRVVFDECFFVITSQRTGDDTYDFAVSKCDGRVKNVLGKIITSWEDKEMQFIGFESDDCGRYLRFEIDGSYLLLTPAFDGLMVGFTGWDKDGNPYELKRHALFKGCEDA